MGVSAIKQIEVTRPADQVDNSAMSRACVACQPQLVPPPSQGRLGRSPLGGRSYYARPCCSVDSAVVTLRVALSLHVDLGLVATPPTPVAVIGEYATCLFFRRSLEGKKCVIKVKSGIRAAAPVVKQPRGEPWHLRPRAGSFSSAVLG